LPPELGRALKIQQQIVALVKQFSKYNEQQLKTQLKSPRATVRFAAAYVVGENKVPLPHELIDLFNDSSVEVQQASRRSLILLACRATGPRKLCAELRSQVKTLLKLGPEPTKNKKLVDKASNKWHTWWDDNDPSLLKLATANQKLVAEDVPDAESDPPMTKETPRAAEQPQAVGAQDAASSKLKLAKALAEEGLEQKARARYEEIVKKYPNSKAAAEARQLLERKKK
jgi:hypothetical protein